MNVKELIHLLQYEDPEAQVHFAYQYGDHWRTVVAPEVTDVADGYVVNSHYHNMPKLIQEDEDPPPNAVNVVVLS